MTLRFRRNDTPREGNSGPAGAQPGDNDLSAVREAGLSYHTAAQGAIDRGLSEDSGAFNRAVRQDGGE